MGWANDTRWRLLLVSGDRAHMKSAIAMLQAHGIQTVRQLTSLLWRSTGIDSLVMVSPEDYPKASALYVDYERGANCTAVSPPRRDRCLCLTEDYQTRAGLAPRRKR
jgi:hypothetical protein